MLGNSGFHWEELNHQDILYRENIKKLCEYKEMLQVLVFGHLQLRLRIISNVIKNIQVTSVVLVIDGVEALQI